LTRTLPLKKRLAAAGKRARAVPAWIMVRTHRRVRFSHRRRNWRTSGRIKP
jgi:ribosomal protein L39E